MDTAQSWARLGAALSFYSDFSYVAVPWTVDESTMMMTCPDPRYITRSDAGCLVGSAEQSFLHMIKTGELGTGDYMAITPCFRHTDATEHADSLHRPYFMKAELIRISEEPLPDGSVIDILNQARDFFTYLAHEKDLDAFDRALKVVNTGVGWDLELNGIEIGSYGARSVGGIHWAYGTGLAEPRFSMAMASLD